MKKTLSLAVLAVALGGCSSIYPFSSDEGTPVYPVQSAHVPTAQAAPAAAQNQPYRLADSHWSDVAKIRDEATRLNYQVAQGIINKVEAAQALNRFRIQLVGRNQVDDDVFSVYLRSASDSQRGAITTDQSKYFIQQSLIGWQQRWPNMRNKPTNPAFTNFLMEVMGMKPLQ